MTCGTCVGDTSKSTEAACVSECSNSNYATQATCGTCPADTSKTSSTTCVDTCYDYTASSKVFSGTACSSVDDCMDKCSDSQSCKGFSSTCSDATTVATAAACVTGCSDTTVSTQSMCKTILQQDASKNHQCAIVAGGKLKCWGSWPHGDGTTASTPARQDPPTAPGDLGTGRTAKQISLGLYFTCAILDDDTLKCWGKNDKGQLGVGSTNDKLTPQSVNLGTGKTAKQVSAGYQHTCAILNDDTLKCWGNGQNHRLGMCGDGYYCSTSNINAPSSDTVDTGQTVKQVSAGYGHTCAILNDNTMKCWGLNNNGRTGRGHTSHARLCAQNNDGDCSGTTGSIDLGSDCGGTCTAKQVACGGLHTCAILNNDKIKCWGDNVHGQLGIGTNQQETAADEFVNLGSGRTAKQVVTGAEHTCAILDDDTVKCWGNGMKGQLGIGSNTYSKTTPQSVNLGTGKTALHITAGGAEEGNGDYDNTCAILNDNTLKCWGSNNNGQLGQGDYNDRNSPTAVTTNLDTASWTSRTLSHEYGDETADSGGTSQVRSVASSCDGVPAIRTFERSWSALTWTQRDWTAGTWTVGTLSLIHI